MTTENDNISTEDTAEFDDAFAEFTGGTPAGDDDKPAGDDDKPAGDDDKPADDDKKVGEKDEKSLDKEGELGDTKNTDEVSVLRAQLETAIKERDIYKHKHSSDAGRNRAYQKRVEELQQSLDSAHKVIEQATNASPNELEELKKKHPNLAALIERQGDKIAKPLQAENAALKAQLEQVAKKVEGKETADVQTQIGEAHSDWKDVIKSDQFKNWLEKQDDTVQGWYYESTTAEDAIAALDLYRVEFPKETPPAPDDEAKKAEEAKKLAEKQKRDQQLAGAAAVPNSSGAPRDIPETDDFDASFEKFAARKQKANAT